MNVFGARVPAALLLLIARRQIRRITPATSRATL